MTANTRMGAILAHIAVLSPLTSALLVSTGNSSSYSTCLETSSGSFTSTGNSSPGSSSCLTTITAMVTKTATVVSTTTTQVLSGVVTINADDYVPDPCYPQTFTQYTYEYTSVGEATTFTTTSTSSITTGVQQTVTEYPPVGFVPVQSTLPDATYARRLGGANPIDDPDNPSGEAPFPARAKRAEDDGLLHGARGPVKRSAAGFCNATTSTLTATVTASSIVTITTTLTGTIVECPSRNTAYEASNFPTLLSVSTVDSTITQYATTVTETITDSTTVPATTTTVYAACATNNFADAIVASNGTVTPIRYTRLDESDGLPFTAYDCCRDAILAGAATWIWSTYNGCYFTLSHAAQCSLDSADITVYIGGDGNDEGPNDERVVGNAYCGQVTTAVPGPAAPPPDIQ